MIRAFKVARNRVGALAYTPKQRSDSRSNAVGSYPNRTRLHTGFVARSVKMPNPHQMIVAPHPVLANLAIWSIM